MRVCASSRQARISAGSAASADAADGPAADAVAVGAASSDDITLLGPMGDGDAKAPPAAGAVTAASACGVPLEDQPVMAGVSRAAGSRLQAGSIAPAQSETRQRRTTRVEDREDMAPLNAEPAHTEPQACVHTWLRPGVPAAAGRARRAFASSPFPQPWTRRPDFSPGSGC